MDVRAAGDEELHDAGMPLRRGPHQRRLPSRRAGVHRGARLEQLPDYLRVAHAGCHHERRFTQQQRRVGVGAGPKQPAHHGRAAVLARDPQRGGAQVVGGVCLGAGTKQERRHLTVVVIAGPMQCRGAVGLGGVHVRRLELQRAPHALRVLGLRGGQHLRPDRRGDHNGQYHRHECRSAPP